MGEIEDEHAGQDMPLILRFFGGGRGEGRPGEKRSLKINVRDLGNNQQERISLPLGVMLTKKIDYCLFIIRCVFI